MGASADGRIASETILGNSRKTNGERCIFKMCLMPDLHQTNSWERCPGNELRYEIFETREREETKRIYRLICLLGNDGHSFGGRK